MVVGAEWYNWWEKHLSGNAVPLKARKCLPIKFPFHIINDFSKFLIRVGKNFVTLLDLLDHSE